MRGSLSGYQRQSGASRGTMPYEGCSETPFREMFYMTCGGNQLVVCIDDLHDAGHTRGLAKLRARRPSPDRGGSLLRGRIPPTAGTSTASASGARQSTKKFEAQTGRGRFIESLLLLGLPCRAFCGGSLKPESAWKKPNAIPRRSLNSCLMNG